VERKPLKILLGYNYFAHAVDIKQRTEQWLSRLRSHGFEVDGIPLSINPPSPAMQWREIDRRWRNGDRELFALYEKLARATEGYDVLVNVNGVNLHPDFVRQLSLYKVYACFDDPESSHWLSQPVAAAYDLSMVGNIDCLDIYRRWGVKEVRWWPIGFHPNDYDPSLDREKILRGERDVDVALLCERLSDRRASRLEAFAAAFPKGSYFGRGWPQGFLPEAQRVQLLQRTKIGPNFHNSTGPVNSRTFVLPANGVMQLCDNKSNLGKIYVLGKEVIGFDTVEEAIDQCRYYLEHDEERRSIAVAGWERACRDYNEVAVFGLLTRYVDELIDKDRQPAVPGIRIVRQLKATCLKNSACSAARQVLSRVNALIRR
jgi:hypothetical protein